MKQRWQRKTERATHADDWLMTYADMITLLLCFFAIFLSLSIPKINSPKKAETTVRVEQPVPPPVEQSVKPPDIPEGNLPFHGITQADQPHVIEGNLPFHDPVPADQPAEKAATPTPAETADNPPAPLPAPPVSPPQPLSLPEIVDHMKSQGAANIEQKGDRITTLEMNSAAFFDSGSAVLSASGKAILKDVAINLKADEYKDYQVTVEGHTDDQPISTFQFPSNWELSTARAAAVVHFFLDQGIPARKLRAAGYADTFPKAPNRDASGNPIPANQAQNRRVVIKLEKIDKG
jgi:chemotaxis protein MotB